jgi:phosphoadenosine phosphosulfate reductase
MDKHITLETMFDEAVEILQTHEPPEGYYVAFSGGKDSIVLLDIVRRSGVKHDAHFNLTSIDPPELLEFIKTHYPDVERHRPELTMFQLIEKWCFLPTAKSRYCCAVLKEHGGSGRTVLTGIRKAESVRRSKRNKFETSFNDATKKMIHLIFDWRTSDIWQYIKLTEMPYCRLYDEGFKRVGCIGCPMTSSQERHRQFARWPNHKKAYIEAIKRALAKKPSEKFGTDAELYFDWFTSNMSVKKYFGKKQQMEIGEANDQRN